MLKKTVTFVIILAMVILLPFQSLAAEISISITDNSGSARVTISQSGSAIFTGEAGFNGTGTINTNDSSEVLVVNVSDVPTYYYSTINGSLAQSTSLQSNISNITVAVTKFTPPAIALTANASGGISYTISDNGPISSYEIEIFENSSSKGTISVTSSSGNLTSISEGKTYSAAARVSGFGYVSEYGSQSNTVTAPSSYSLILKTTDGGTVGDVSNSYIPGSSITLNATAQDGYSFISWSCSGGGEFSNIYARETTFTMPAENVTITATFKKTFKFVIMSSTGGKVWDVDGYYYEGQSVTVSAIPSEGYDFDSWVSSDGGKFVDSKAVETTFTMPANATTVTASFKELNATPTNPDNEKPDETEEQDTGMFEIKTTVHGNGNIVINQNKGYEGQKITVRATAQAGYIFESWSSEGGGSFADETAAATTFEMPASDVNIIANFVQGDGTDGTDTLEEEGKDKKPLSKGLLIIISVGVIVLVSAAVGILLILKERNKRRDAYDDSYFSDMQMEEEEEPVVYDYDEDTAEFVPEEEINETYETYEGYEISDDRNEAPSNQWRQQRKRRNQFKDNVYRTDDWDD